MTAVAKLLPCPFCGKSVATLSNTDELSGRPDISFMHTVVCNAHAGGCGSTVGYESDQDDAIATWNRRAALSPAELGGVELPVGEVSDGFSGHQRAVNLYGPIRCQPAPGTKLYTTPRAAEAIDDAMVERACKTYDDKVGGGDRAYPSAMRAALTAALTPPSAKGE